MNDLAVKGTTNPARFSPCTYSRSARSDFGRSGLSSGNLVPERAGRFVYLLRRASEDAPGALTMAEVGEHRTQGVPEAPMGHQAAVGECMEWPGTRSYQGYGVFTKNWKQHKAHRAAWEQANGQKIPPGMVVMHLCDNPPCINPDHLRLGTHGDNARDRQAKGRTSRVVGEQHGQSKITRAQAEEIRRRYRPHVVTCSQLGEEYGLSESGVHNIVRGKTWR